jgi:hypothetical protein
MFYRFTVVWRHEASMMGSGEVSVSRVRFIRSSIGTRGANVGAVAQLADAVHAHFDPLGDEGE